MPRKAVLLAALLGGLWNFVLLGLLITIRRGAWELAYTGLVPGALAGLCAGYWAIRSRVRRKGREHLGDALLAYCGAVAVYALSCMLFAVTLDGEVHTLGRYAPWAMVIAMTFAVQFGIVLFPLFVGTRIWLWRAVRDGYPLPHPRGAEAPVS